MENKHGMPFELGDETKKDLDKIIYRVNKGKKIKDAVIIYSGEEGSGKTTLMTQHAYYVGKECGQDLTLENYSFTPQQLIDNVNAKNWPRGTPQVYDEAITGLMAQLGNTKWGKQLHIMFSTCRSKGYPIFLAAPRFYELPYWMAVDRSLVHYYTYEVDEDGYNEGRNYFRGYDRENKKWYYIFMKKYRYKEANRVLHTRPRHFSGWPFSQRHHKELPFTYEEYEKKKREALRDDKEVKDSDFVKEIAVKLGELGFNVNVIAEIVGKSDTQVRRYLGKVVN